jgi:hypothetical protein
MSGPFAVSARRDGGFYIADAGADVVRLVSRRGRITTVAGTGRRGFAGDGGPAKRARLAGPHGISALDDGGFLIADTLNNRVRRVLPDGRIVTVAGRAARGYRGDGGRATRARLNQPKAVAMTPDGGILIGDALNDAVRWIAPDEPRRLAVAIPGRRVRAGTGETARVVVVSTLEARVRVTLTPSGATATARVEPGRTAVTVQVASAESGRVSVIARARGQVATARATLVVR